MLIFLDPPPMPNKSEILGVELDNLCFNKSTRSLRVTLSLTTTDQGILCESK